MGRPHWSRVVRAALCVVCLTATTVPASAIDLMDAWRAAQKNDLDYATSRAAQQAGATRRNQADALWRPTLTLSGVAGIAGNETSTAGAQFSAPGFGTSQNVAFNTSVNHGTLGRLALSASLPLFNRERRAQGRQLALSADVADLEWQEAQQSLMLNTAQRYFDVVLASESLRVLRQQHVAVLRALTEMRDRFRLGDVPVTDTHESAARSEAIAAQVLALDTELQLKHAAFADATGLQPAGARLMLPAREAAPADAKALAFWLSEAEARNPQLRMQIAAVEVARQEAAKSSAILSPNVDLVAQVNRERLNGSGDFGSASSSSGNRMIGVQVAVPLYTGGMRSARQQESIYAIDKAQSQANRTRQLIAQQARAAWLGLTLGNSRVAALSKAMESSRSRLDATRLGRQVGDRTTMDLLNAENDAATAELMLLQARVELLVNRLRLAAVAGRLDEPWLRAVNAELQAPGGR